MAAFERVRRLAGAKPALTTAALAARYVAARATSVITLLVAAWFFTLDAFAAFGVYAALANLAWAGIFLRYENAVIAAGSEDEARAAVRLCAAIGTLLWALISLLALASARKLKATHRSVPTTAHRRTAACASFSSAAAMTAFS